MFVIDGVKYVNSTQAGEFFGVKDHAIRIFSTRHKDYLYENGALLNVTADIKRKYNLHGRSTYLYGFQALLHFYNRSHYRDVNKVFELCEWFGEDVKRWIDKLTFESSKERQFGVKLTEALNGIDNVHQHYNVDSYYIDFYLPTYNIAIEFDEFAHKYKEDADKTRQKYLENRLGCVFIRISEDEEISVALNKVFLKILRTKQLPNVV